MSYKNACDFAKSVGSTVQDLRSNIKRRSDYKVSYTKDQGKNRIIND